ncbi:AraC family transcriptional regulator [Secundilactobacillus kimchicus]|uniref:Transcriptional regulator n=2 Tax=Secundilactobacillus kimchicus TaxID=528209 RepID=A0A0R1HMI6_9LACO|nr:AraC family transcriptional regulator [Secundilactobacillus kimchicus]KRK47724.1 transcriptional regulator [Secundilactobacillus kimchicus JCM 15530]MBT9672611.1 helix-turn-helix domain-containing protein [Secundilactobacillus kimchicus]
MSKKYISMSCLPLPTFVEGNQVTFEPGEEHPNRTDLQYFVLIFMTAGRLYIAEDGTKYTVNAGELFLLQPKHHHYSWRKMDQTTSYYWLHFYTSGNWRQSATPVTMAPSIEVPTLHYFTPTLTLHLPKHIEIPDHKGTLSLVKQLFAESKEQEDFGFWRSQQLFIDVLQSIQIRAEGESKLVALSKEVQRFLRDHFNEKITSTVLSDQFHYHPNYITRSLKATIGLTPFEYLSQYRMEEAEKRLLNTDLAISEIAEDVGYQNIYYFSTAFKKYTGSSPKKYRSLKQRKV